MAHKRVQVVRLGRMDYAAALTLQRDVQAQRKAGQTGDTLLLTEHNPVLTLGRGADARHLRVSRSALDVFGIALVQTERGGDITYHGPGQLVAYPILDLRSYGRDVHRYIRDLEETAIRLLRCYGVNARRQPGSAGVWAGEDKIASAGVFVSRWVTMHGIAINIAPNLAHFELIHPCGLAGQRMTSIADQRGRAPAMEDAFRAFASVFAEVFEVRFGEER